MTSAILNVSDEQSLRKSHEEALFHFDQRFSLVMGETYLF
jgi:hypothetical protein